MSHDETPKVTEDTLGQSRPQLEEMDVEEILNAFRQWITQHAQNSNEELDTFGSHASEGPDLFTLLSNFVSLKQEIHLQTRSTRSQQEQSNKILEHLEETLEKLSSNNDPRNDKHVRNTLKTLIETYDALALAKKEVVRMADQLLPEWEITSQDSVIDTTARSKPKLSFLARIFGLQRIVDQIEDQHANELSNMQNKLNQNFQSKIQQSKNFIASLISGYTMGLDRLERSMNGLELCAIEVVGEPFDPECMEALEIVISNDVLQTEVIEEVRRGYLWNDSVFRNAQVRVAKPSLSENLA